VKRTISALVLLVIGIALLAIPVLLTFGSPLMSDMDDYFIAHGQAETAANNIVTSVVFDFRGFDTLGESVVLFTAVVGVGLMFRTLRAGEEYEDE
jgi:Multisubunit Na+/H+ antiporter, MnhB subunit